MSAMTHSDGITRRPLVLLLDKDEALRHVVKRQLGDANIAFDLADDAAGAAVNSAENPYAVVLVDLDEPAFDGRAYLTALKSQRMRPAVIVVHTTELRAPLDPELVTVIVRKPYDALVLSSILLACAIRRLPGQLETDPQKEIAKC